MESPLLFMISGRLNVVNCLNSYLCSSSRASEIGGFQQTGTLEKRYPANVWQRIVLLSFRIPANRRLSSASWLIYKTS
ncbi:hypothetical protein BJX70DRAFT_376374 [Aspergillus crustosus]